MHERVKCAYVASKCSGRCSCKVNNLPCNELCKCEAAEGSCNNLPIDEIDSEDGPVILYTVEQGYLFLVGTWLFCFLIGMDACCIFSEYINK